MIRISDIRREISDDESVLFDVITKKYGIKNIRQFEISKKSIDARKKNDIHYVYAVDLCADNEDSLIRKYRNIKRIEKKPYIFPEGQKTENSIVIAGMGPAGFMCALTLVQNGYKVVVLERGKRVDERKTDVDTFWNTGALNTASNVQFGEGGAGTFSDGKLTTGIKDLRIRKVLEEFYAHGAPEEILYYSKPHIGTDNLCHMVESIREDIISRGGDVRFSSQLTSIKTKAGAVYAAVVNNEYEIRTDNIVLAIGHSARDTFEMLKNNGINMEQKSFSVGARIEHKQELINKAQYGDKHKELPAADYKLSVHLENGRGVYTFCMCPGGEVVASASEEGGIVTNGMSCFARDGENANSAVLVSVTPEDFKSDDPLEGMYFQREIETRAFKAANNTYNAPSQRVGDFLGEAHGNSGVEPSYRPGVTWTSLDNIFPEYVTNSMREAIRLMDKKLHGFADNNAILTAPETRSSSPVRILRDKETLQSSVKGLYPCGEGAGYAGGITSAAVDGIKVAEPIAKNNR